MNAPEEHVQLLVTVHGPVDAMLLAKLAQVVANHVPGCRAESVDGEADIVFVRPRPDLGVAVAGFVGDTTNEAIEVSWTSGPAAPAAPTLAIVPDPAPPVEPEPEPPPVPPTAAVPRVGTAAVGTADAPVIIDPSYGDAETRARRLKVYLDQLDLPESIPADLDAAKDAHRRGVLWKDSQKVWHCPWCPRTAKQAAHVGRHRQGCPRKPGEHEDRRMLASLEAS